MSFPVSPAGGMAAQPKVVSLPQTQKIVQDLIECVRQLKEEFTSSRLPITDDNQILQRFCAKLEQLFRFEMKDRFTMMGKKKDYWDYFCDCLASNKGANDGVKYVKAVGEHKTSQGKGRAFIRFALVHQRLADSLQQCIMHPKTGDWYNAGSVWLQSKVPSTIITSLYDLNDIHFDLSPRGYDLDNAWPSFARNNGATGSWNIPISRRSSITSMDTLSIASSDPSEINRLQQELASAETARSVLAESVSTLEQERQRAEKTVWMTQGELSAMQQQLKQSVTKCEELQMRCASLEQSQVKFEEHKAKLEDDTAQRSAQLDALQERLTQEQTSLLEREAALTASIAGERSQFASEVQSLQQKLSKASEANEKLMEKIASLEETVVQLKAWDLKKEQQISHLEQLASGLEQRNTEVTDELSKSLAARESEAASHLDSAQKYHDLVSKLKDLEGENIRFQASNMDLQSKCETLQKSVEEEKSKSQDLTSYLEKLKSLSEDLKLQLDAEMNKNNEISARLDTLNRELQTQVSKSKETSDKFLAEVDQKTADNEKTKAEMEHLAVNLKLSKQQEERLSRYNIQLIQLVMSSPVIGNKPAVPDMETSTDCEVADFLDRCRKSASERWSELQGKLHEAEDKVSCLTAERNQLLQMVDKIGHLLPDQVEFTSADLTQQLRDLENRIHAVCTQLSDLNSDRHFLKEQLQMAQGEHSDKGKQLSHLEGRLLELERALKESRTSESSLQGQVVNLQVLLASAESCKDALQLSLDKAKAETIVLQEERDSLEKMSSHLEKQVKEMSVSLATTNVSLTESTTRETSLREMVEQLETELLELQELHHNKNVMVASLQEKLKEGEQTVENFLSSLASLETDKTAIACEPDSPGRNLADAGILLEMVIAEKGMLEARAKELAARLLEVSEELDDKIAALASVASEREAWEVSKIGLREDIQTLVSELQKQRELTDTVSADKAELKTSLNGAEERIDRLSQELDTLRDSLQRREVEAAALVEKHFREVEVIQQQVLDTQYKAERLAEQLHDAQMELGEAQQKLTEERTVHAQDVEELERVKSSVSELSQKVVSISQQLSNASDQVSTLTESNRVLLEENSSLGSRLEEVSVRLAEKEASFTEKLQTLHSQLETSRTEKAELQNSASSSQKDTMKLLQEKQVLVVSVQRENESLVDRLEGLEREIKRLVRENELLEEQAVQTTGSLTQKTEEVEELRSQMASMMTVTERMRSDSASEKSELEDSLQKLQSRFTELQDAMHAVITERDELAVQQVTAAEDISELRADLAASSDGYNFLLQSSQKVAEDKDAEITQLRSRLKDSEQALGVLSSQLEQTISELRSEVQKLEASLREKESALHQKEDSYSSQVESLQQELSALQFQLSAEQLQYEESLRAMGDHKSTASQMSSRLEEQETLISDLEQELCSLQTSFELERTNQNHQMEQLKSLLKGKELEGRKISEKLQSAEDQLEELTSCTEMLKNDNYSLRLSLDRDIEEREEEIRILRSDNEQLKKQLIKIVRDKARLWQQSDALAEHKRKSQGRWLDNSLVTKCMGCQSDFSLFLRKHHCRLCGRIFCYNCSDNWVDSSASSQKSRACTPCFKELQSLDVSIARASIMPDDSDDESGNVSTSEDNLSQQSSQNGGRQQCSPRAKSSEASVYEEAREEILAESDSPGEDIYAGARSNGSNSPQAEPDLAALTSTPEPTVSESGSSQEAFQVITQEEITKSVAAYDESPPGPLSLIDVPNMSSSMLLSADDLAKGEINTQNEAWVKPGKIFVVPISMTTPFTTVRWQFTVQPKDIEFSIKYSQDDKEPVSQAEFIVVPTRCNSVKEPVHGELTAKQAGVYTLVFDNSYSRMTSKKIHYELKYEDKMD